jgi:hypothetical protein
MKSYLKFVGEMVINMLGMIVGLSSGLVIGRITGITNPTPLPPDAVLIIGVILLSLMGEVSIVIVSTIFYLLGIACVAIYKFARRSSTGGSSVHDEKGKNK